MQKKSLLNTPVEEINVGTHYKFSRVARFESHLSRKLNKL